MKCVQVITLALAGSAFALPVHNTQRRAVDEKCLNKVSCTLEYAPVCGTNGKTYPNTCVLKANAKCGVKGLKVASKGECKCALKTCTEEYRPVCGSDGKTYGNLCGLEVAQCDDPGLAKASDGECPKKECGPKICTADYRPVCGSDGQTYGNPCQLEAAQCTNPGLVKASDGECPKAECAAMICPADYNPVCGSDDETYSNACTLEVAQCTNPNLRKASEGECPAKADEKCLKKIACTLDYKPVCGTDGKTYPNTCVLKANAKCGVKGLKVASKGECPEEPKCEPKACTMDWAPVCGNDGKTYGNMCALEAAQCESPGLTKASDGECPKKECGPKVCTADYRPVCGSDGQTYGNPCALEAAQCENPGLTKASDGECPTN